MSEPLDYSEAQARRYHCWFDVDRVPRDPATTAWKRRARWAQAQWRQARGYPIGTVPYRGGAHATPVGSRMDLAFAREGGANFIEGSVREAVRARLAAPEPHQMLNEDRLWADLLSSMPLCFNLFGALAGDGNAARRAVATWCPDAPQGEVRVRFEHSPGRRDRAFLGNRTAFDVAFELAAGKNDERGILGVETKYHEHALAEPLPKPTALARYVEVTERARIFGEGWRENILGTDLQQIWLDHLLVLSMLQHPSQRWVWGRFALVFPRANPSFTVAARRYADLLLDRSTFVAWTLEDLCDTTALGADITRAVTERYLLGGSLG